MSEQEQVPCDHCHTQPAVVVDYRGLDVISKYRLCADCAALTDEQFFNAPSEA